MSAAYRPDPGWTVRVVDGGLAVIAGADAVYLVEDLPHETAERLAASWADGLVEPAVTDVRHTEAVSQLLTLGALVPEIERSGSRLAVTVRWVGDPIEELPPLLGAAVPAGIDIASRTADIDLVVRTNAPLGELVDAPVSRSQRPHLLVDLAYEHVVVVGPLVVPGDTACLGCLASRVLGMWGDTPVPPRPNVQRHLHLAAGLVAYELDRIERGSPETVNATISWDLAASETRRAALHRVPWCAVCEPAPPSGLLRLPWLTEEAR